MGSYVANTAEDRKAMLNVIGISDESELFGQIRNDVKIDQLNLPDGMSEIEVRRAVEAMADENKIYKTIFRGAGAYRHYIPSIVNSVITKEDFLTAYTPYQAEISQGILQSIFEYQTMICKLTGMDVSNACVYDGAEAAAEAVAMCKERKKDVIYVSAAMHPHTIETIKTYCFGNEMKFKLIPQKGYGTDIEWLKNNIEDAAAGVIIQHPNFYGQLEEAADFAEVAHAAKAKFVMSVNPISLGCIKTPAEYGADIAVGEGQPLGLPLSFGGPYIGFMATSQKNMRKLPGRIVGQTKDHNGKLGYVLTLQAREQHIRREKASSNICSNQALCALAVGVYISAMGNEGIREASVQSMSKAHYMAQELSKIGYELKNDGEFYHEFVTSCPVNPDEAMSKLDEAGILGGLVLKANDVEPAILWCCTEANTKEEIDRAVAVLKEV